MRESKFTRLQTIKCKNKKVVNLWNKMQQCVFSSFSEHVFQCFLLCVQISCHKFNNFPGPRERSLNYCIIRLIYACTQYPQARKRHSLNRFFLAPILTSDNKTARLQVPELLLQWFKLRRFTVSSLNINTLFVDCTK
jgi:hypothetical protein